MPCFVEICFLLLLSGNSEETGWLGSPHGGSDEGGGGIYGVGNFLGRPHGELGFPIASFVVVE